MKLTKPRIEYKRKSYGQIGKSVSIRNRDLTL